MARWRWCAAKSKPCVGSSLCTPKRSGRRRRRRLRARWPSRARHAGLRAARRPSGNGGGGSERLRPRRGPPRRGRHRHGESARLSRAAGRVEWAAAVASVFARGGVLLAEAGTGTGKTLAYLVPAILSRDRVLISTGTKNLQEQIFFKDIPALREALGIPFTATCMKGRANYLCLQRLDQLKENADLFADQSMFLPMIREWAAATPTGDRAELRDLPEDLPFWNE